MGIDHCREACASFVQTHEEFLNSPAYVDCAVARPIPHPCRYLRDGEFMGSSAIDGKTDKFAARFQVPIHHLFIDFPHLLYRLHGSTLEARVASLIKFIEDMAPPAAATTETDATTTSTTPSPSPRTIFLLFEQPEYQSRAKSMEALRRERERIKSASKIKLRDRLEFPRDATLDLLALLKTTPSASTAATSGGGFVTPHNVFSHLISSSTYRTPTLRYMCEKMISHFETHPSIDLVLCGDEHWIPAITTCSYGGSFISAPPIVVSTVAAAQDDGGRRGGGGADDREGSNSPVLYRSSAAAKRRPSLQQYVDEDESSSDEPVLSTTLASKRAHLVTTEIGSDEDDDDDLIPTYDIAGPAPVVTGISTTFKLYRIKTKQWMTYVEDTPIAPYGEAEVLACWFARQFLLSNTDPNKAVAVLSGDYDVLGIMLLMAADIYGIHAGGTTTRNTGEMYFVFLGHTGGGGSGGSKTTKNNCYVYSLRGLWDWATPCHRGIQYPADDGEEEDRATKLVQCEFDRKNTINALRNKLFLLCFLGCDYVTPKDDWNGGEGPRTLYGFSAQFQNEVEQVMFQSHRSDEGIPALWTYLTEADFEHDGGRNAPELESIFPIEQFEKFIEWCETVRFHRSKKTPLTLPYDQTTKKYTSYDGFSRLAFVLCYWSGLFASYGGPSLSQFDVEEVKMS